MTKSLHVSGKGLKNLGQYLWANNVEETYRGGTLGEHLVQVVT
jgi:hypothetical protein